MTDWFYRDFENRFRGSRELIRTRLVTYLPLIQPLVVPDCPARAVDLGCGRGEWLELLVEQGFDASGIDLDDGMLAACRERGLNVKNADAIATLQSLPNASVALVSAFHVVEHLPFDDVRVLVTQALRVLIPGGVLILETPNPENLTVGSCSFYMDPSHLHPLPSALLCFLTEHVGFGRSKVVYLQESPHLHQAQSVELIDVLIGVSPDYSVVAQKNAEPKLMRGMDDFFQAEFGLSLTALASRYDQPRDLHVANLENELTLLGNQLTLLEESVALLAAQLTHTTDQLSKMDGALHDLLSSRSWRITAPLRWSSILARRVWFGLAHLFKGRL